MTMRNLVALLCVAALYAHVSTYHAVAENPPPESSSSTPILTDDQINKLIKVGEKYGPNARIDKRATDALGLTKGDDQLFLTQTATKERSGEMRAFYALPNGGGYLLAFVPEHNSRYWYHVDKNFRLLGGILIKNGDGKTEKGTSVINAPEAQQAVNTELKGWSEFADHIDPDALKKGVVRDVNPLPSASPK